MSAHQFGGDWTNEKLERIRKYLSAYTIIFKGNEQARKLFPIYVDAFAGTGYRTPSQSSIKSTLPLPELSESDNQDFLKGSACIALDVEPPFRQYIFIERDPQRARELNNLKNDYPNRSNSIKIINEEANSYLINWCTSMGKMERAVMFLDPYGMQVEWQLIEAIARTQKIDLWILFPLGVAINRLLTRTNPPPPEWAVSLTRQLGTDEWREVFYPTQKVLTLFGEEDIQPKQADFEKIGQFFVRRLKTVFTAVAGNPLPLMNSKNNPLYLLCFASGNPKGAATAVKIAQHILRK
jgi:three-Cys-motif partner protein